MNEALPLALVAAALFGAAVVTSKLGLHHVRAIQGASISIPSTAVMFWLLAPFFLDTADFSMAAAGVFGVVGLVFPAAVTLLVFHATDRMGPTISNSVSSTAPMFAIFGAVVFLGEALTGGRVLGTLGIIAGIIALSWDEESRPRQWPIWIIVLPLSAAVIRGGALTLTKFGLNLWPNPYAASLIGYTISAVVVISAMRLSTAKYAPAAGYSKIVPWFVAVGLCNGTAVLLTYSALGKGDVGLVSPIIATSPLFTLALSTVLFKQEKITARFLAGVGLTVAGLVVLVTM